MSDDLQNKTHKPRIYVGQDTFELAHKDAGGTHVWTMVMQHLQPRPMEQQPVGILSKPPQVDVEVEVLGYHHEAHDIHRSQCPIIQPGQDVAVQVGAQLVRGMVQAFGPMPEPHTTGNLTSYPDYLLRVAVSGVYTLPQEGPIDDKRP